MIVGKKEEKKEEERLTLYGAYHFARRVLPLVPVSRHETSTEEIICELGDGVTHCRFWIRMKDSTICTIEWSVG